ncbi:hypothetical protein ZIOFF_039029 [Zingiber officinale]|uniref:Protein TIFY n=1 Tax=Zingiber officinale TaxID=94328 RepID=A0A8J5KZW4_ZINOF|nr:hypothetical protein ZIOFF_039029 [Zingiber officinale]
MVSRRASVDRDQERERLIDAWWLPRKRQPTLAQAAARRERGGCVREKGKEEDWVVFLNGEAALLREGRAEEVAMDYGGGQEVGQLHPHQQPMLLKSWLLRCRKSCRLRWTNYLRPDLKRGLLSKEEEKMLVQDYVVPSREAQKSQLSIFYGGKVLVFDNFPAEKAKNLMKLASKGSSTTNSLTCVPPSLLTEALTSSGSLSYQKNSTLVPKAASNPVIFLLLERFRFNDSSRKEKIGQSYLAMMIAVPALAMFSYFALHAIFADAGREDANQISPFILIRLFSVLTR